MKRLLLLTFATVLAGCSPEPTHEGFPISYWRRELKKSDYMTRWHACNVFTSMGRKGKEAIPDLVICLKDDHQEVRQQAAMALGRMQADAKEAVPAILELLHDPAPIVRE